MDNGGFNFPRAIAVDSGNNIYVTNDNDIRIFNENGNFITFWPISGSAWFANPLGITVDNTGNVFVVSTSNNEILKMDENGNLLLTWGSAGVGLGQFNSPAGIGLIAFKSARFYYRRGTSRRGNRPAVGVGRVAKKATVFNQGIAGIVAGNGATL